MAESERNQLNFWLSIPFSYIAIISILSGIGYLVYLVSILGESTLSLFGQLTLILSATFLLMFIIALFSLYLGEFKPSGYLFGLSIIAYGLSKITFYLTINNFYISLKSPLVYFVLLLISGIFFIATAFKIESERSTIFVAVATLFLLASWIYYGYFNYTHFDMYDTYGIIRGSLIESLRSGFREPIFIFLGGAFFPFVAIGALITSIAFGRDISVEDSTFLKGVGLASTTALIFGTYIGFYPHIRYLAQAVSEIEIYDPSLLIGGLELTSMLLLFTSVISLFNLFGFGVTYVIERRKEIPERPTLESIGIVAREEEEREEGIEEIDLEDLELDL